MPFLLDYKPKTETGKTWHNVIHNALLRRGTAEQIEPALKELHSKDPASAWEVARILLDFRDGEVVSDDPLLYHYARLLLRLKYTTTQNILLALLATSRFTRKTQPEPRNTGLPTLEERLFFLLTQLHMTGEVSSAPSDAHGQLYALTRWMHAVTEWETGKQLEGGALHTADAFAFGMYEALASLVLTIFGTPTFRDVTKQAWWKKRRPIVVAQMDSFDSHVLQWMQSSMAGRMRAMTTIPPFIETDEKGNPVLNDQQILQSVPDQPVMRTKAGLFVWLNACLYARPLTDDMAMLAYLQARYSGETQTMVVDLLIACFDVLANFLLYKESEQTLKLMRSFMCNKVPSILSLLSAFMAPPMTVETCVQMAFMTISMDALPPLSEGAVEARDKLKLARTELLQACFLHGLVSEVAVADIVQEPMSMPRNKYTKEGLMAQCSNNISRFESLIGELDNTVGNAAAISGCIVDSISNFCVSKDTVSLKSVCNMLTKRIAMLDIITQYTQPPLFLLPICNVLNEWVHDQDQAELTPSYEEFSSILLFLYAAVHRYDLHRRDLGLPPPGANPGNFTAKLFQERCMSTHLNDLTEEQTAQLGKWVEGLYGTDEQGESSGISDEVMRQCPPQAFFLLVPTLLEQSIWACRSSALPMKTFKGGLELLVEPFLLPSLIGGLRWIVNHAWEDQGDTDTLLQVLDKLLKPSSSSSDTKAMHQAVFAIIAKPMYQTLKQMIKKKPMKEKQINSLTEVLKPHLDSQRTTHSHPDEFTEWTETPDGGIKRCVRNAIDNQIAWVSNLGPTPPPKYTHRLFSLAFKWFGAGPVLDTILESVKDHISRGNGPIVLDVCTAILAAPSHDILTAMPGMVGPLNSNPSGKLSVRDALRLRVMNPQSLLRRPEAEAEAIVLLARRVEAQLAVNQLPQMALPIPMQDNAAAEQIMADLGLADHAGPGAGTALDGHGGTADFGGADLDTALGGSIDLSGVSAQDLSNAAGNAAAAAGTGAGGGGDGAGASTDHDIFSDLGLTLDSASQQLQDSSGNIGDGQGDMEEDIFAGLDMMGVDDDFNFS